MTDNQINHTFHQLADVQSSMDQDLITAVASKCTLASVWLPIKPLLKNAGPFFLTV